MSTNRENSPFVIEFKNNYGTTTATTPQSPSAGISLTPSTFFCLHGQSQVKLRGHCHRQRISGMDVKARKKLIIASVLCLVFMVVEIIGGVISNSLAIATDAAHLLTDFASFMISLFAIWIAGRPSTRKMSFGWYRAEVIGAVASVFMIWVITAILVWLAVQRVINQSFELEAKAMLITAGLAILVNIIMGVILYYNPGHGHSHGGGGGHGHSKPKPQSTTLIAHKKTNTKDRKDSSKSATESYTPRITDGIIDTTIVNHNKDDHIADGTNGTIEENNSNNIGNNVGPSLNHATTGTTEAITNIGHDNSHSGDDHVITSTKGAPKDNINVRAAFIHVLGDAIQSVGVFIAALVIYFKPEWAIADPICTFIFSIIVLYTTFSIMKDALLVLMEGTPSYLEYAEVMQIFLEIDGVQRIHNLRIWALSINKVALAVHLAIKPGANPQKILQEATNAVHIKYNFFETTIQIEEFTPEMEECQQCILPNS